jgi:hypothetical protein
MLAMLVMGAAGCAGNFPVLTFPQLQAVNQIGEYGTDRWRASDACRKSSTSVDAYVQCMADKGWKFIDRGNVYPGPQCWSLRAAGDPSQMPTPDCFEQAAPAPVSTPKATTAPFMGP